MRKQMALGGFIWLCVAVTVALAVRVICQTYLFSLNSDGSTPLIITRLGITTGSFIPSDWIYANGDLWILGSRIFLTILYPIFGFGFGVIAAANLCSYIFLVVTVYGTCRLLLPKNHLAAAIGAVIVAGCFSSISFEYIVGEGAYALYTALALAVFALTSSKVFDRANLRSSTTTTILVSTATFIMATSNATRAAITVVAPLLAGHVISYMQRLITSTAQQRPRHNVANVAASVLGFVAGSVIYKYYLLPTVYTSTGVSGFHLANLSEITEHVTRLPAAWFDYFSIAPWHALSPLLSAIQLLMLFLSFCLIAAPLIVVVSPSTYGDRLTTFAWITLSSYAVSFAALVLTQNMFVDASELRYATFAFSGSACIVAALVAQQLDKHPVRGLLLTAIVCVAPVATIGAWHTIWTPGGSTFRDRMALIESLRAQHIGAFLATYWNSHSLSILSNGQVEGYPVGLNENYGLGQLPMNSPRKIIYGSAGRLQAVVLTRDQMSPAIAAAIASELGPAASQFRSNQFVVLVYGSDIVKRIYGTGTPIDTRIPSDHLGIELSQDRLPPCRSSSACIVNVQATNIGEHTLVSFGTKPLRLGIRGVDAQDRTVSPDLGRVDLLSPLSSGASEMLRVVLPPAPNADISAYRLCLLQESVAWHCGRTVSRRAWPAH